MQIQAGQTHAVFDCGDSSALHRIYSHARLSVGDRIEIDCEIERRLAVIVLFTYADALARAVPDTPERAIVEICVQRLMAQTSMG